MEEDRFELLIDADSCPRNLRVILLRAIERRQLRALFAADRVLSDVMESAKHLQEATGRDLIQMTVVEKGLDSADDFLVLHAGQGMVAITRDVPLAFRLAEKGAVVLDDRGGVYTRETVAERLSMRNIMTDLREAGVFAERTRALGQREIQAFANALDRELTRMRKTVEKQTTVHIAAMK